MMELVLVGVLGYLLGSIPVGFLVGKQRGIDIRKYGSGATGGTNVLRTLGPTAAIFTGVSDLLKGTLAAYIGLRAAGDWGFALAGVLAAVGHSYPVWLGFKGGKSVATSGGVLLVTQPWAVLAALVAGVAAIVPTRWVSLGSLVATATAVLVILLTGAPTPHQVAVVALLVVIYIRHWENMKRIAAGTENRIGQKAKPRPEA
ncbi:MAG: glycerol-3-phosphate 1-O-acyltransferase PlsY [Bacillota bacterium]